MRLYIIRHGETPWNTQLRLQGQTDVELNEKGRALAKATAQALRSVPFDIVITSPLARARETAVIVAKDRDIPFLEDARIREISFGEMEGRHVPKEERQDPNSKFYSFFNVPEHYVPAAGGESIIDLCSRAAAFLDDLKQKQAWKDKTILVSTHGAASRALLLAVKKIPLKDFWQGGVPKNCAVSILDLEHGNWCIKEQDVVYYENV